MAKRIGILTGGGDVPGLNPCIKAVVEAASERGWEVIGFRRGWGGPLHFNPDDDAAARAEHLMPLDPTAVRRIDRFGGTILHTSRTNPSKVAVKELPDFLAGRAEDAVDGKVDCTDHVLRVFAHLGLDAMVPIGGDDTLSYAARLHQEGFPVVAAPKTMDNDVYGTEYCMGFSTAVSRSVEAINNLRTPAGSHERIAVIELFGRNSGETALISGHIAAADRVLIPEVPFDFEKLAEFVAADHAANPSSYAVVVVSEGAHPEEGEIVESGEPDAYGHKKLGGIGSIVGAELKRMTGIQILNQSLAYIMRGGEPDAVDKLVSTSFGTMAVQHLADGRTGLMMALVGGKYTTVPVDTCIAGVRTVDVEELYDAENYRPNIREVAGKPMYLY
ncbi:MAG: ATP-dependent 6-phosphofructokinase [Sphingomonadales bacterium]|nr:ATP-dependent 6-phosphofructokinase [Sphingomonadales bacterium]